MTVIYADILLALNLFIDYLLLAATARVLQLPFVGVRRVLGALTGAASSLLILLPPLPTAVTLLTQIASAAVMVAVAFRFRGWGAYIKQTAVLFAVSALFAGICLAGYTWLSPQGLTVKNGVVYYAVPPLLLVALTCISYGVLCLFERLTRKRAAKGYDYRVEIVDRDCRVILHAMLDSGHSLCDRFSGAPVILAKEHAVRTLCAHYDPVAVSGRPRGPVRYIPYHCVAGDGVLAAFRPPQVTLYADGRAVDISGVWIAATTALVRDEYDALIGPAVTDMIPQSPSERGMAL